MTPFREAFRKKAEELHGGHYYCEDSWYSCPLATDGTAREVTECDCRWEERVTEIELELIRAYNQGVEASVAELKADMIPGTATRPVKDYFEMLRALKIKVEEDAK